MSQGGVAVEEKEYKVSGYSFANLQQYKEAKREAESVDYIKANTDLNDMSKTLKLYHKLVEKNTLKTIVGYGFLKELQDRIIKDGIVSSDNLPCISIAMENMTQHIKSNIVEQKMGTKNHSMAEEYKIRHKNSRIINMFLVMIIIIMFIVSYISDRNLLKKYENDIINQYSSWEEELNAREKVLDAREKVMEEKEITQTQE